MKGWRVGAGDARARVLLVAWTLAERIRQGKEQKHM